MKFILTKPDRPGVSVGNLEKFLTGNSFDEVK